MSQKEKLRKNRFLRNRRSFILLTILCMGIGFAFLSSNLTITGNTSVSGNSWNVYFTNVQVTDSSVEASVVPTTTGTNTTSIDYTVTLDKPGDFYEFTVDAVNDGTIDAMIQNVNMTSLDSDVAKYLTYTATYINGVTLASNDVLAKNTTETYKVRIEYKKDISASDLSEESVNLNLTFGVNYQQSSNNSKLSEFTALVKNNALRDRNIDFSQQSSNTNGNGLYILESTKTDTYPIYYYRGAVDNNNALFAGYCWKIVRTTETGGTKLIYNGTPGPIYTEFEKINRSSYINVTNESDYVYTFDETNKIWKNTTSTEGQEVEISFSIDASGDYFFHYNVNTDNHSWVEASIYKNGEEIAVIDDFEGLKENTIDLYNLSSSTTFTIKFRKYSDEINEDGITFYVEKGIGNTVLGCANKQEATQLSSKSSFQENDSSLAYVGYMYGEVYDMKTRTINGGEGYLYGNSFVYNNGTYTLVDTSSQVGNSRHYSCFNETGVCENVYYVFGKYYTNAADYITLANGKTVEDALNEMNVNSHDSLIKQTIDSWFENSLQSYFTSNSKNYINYLEDTIWCNDRSLDESESEFTIPFSQSGWNPNGGNISVSSVYYTPRIRKDNGTPTLECSSKNDSFTVAESATGNGALTYPVGLLTADEVMLAGAQSGNNYDYYLYTGQKWWTMSPYLINGSLGGTRASIALFGVYENGSTNNFWIRESNNGIRPSISLKPEVKIATGGDGTSLHPYEFVLE